MTGRWLMVPLFLALVWVPGGAQAVPSQLAFGGVLLGQYLKAVEKGQGEPYETRTEEDGSLVKAFRASPGHETYWVYGCPAPEKNRIFSIQLSGEPAPGIPDLAGVSLGSREAEVVKHLGVPSFRKVYMDGGVEYTLLDFDGRNYSLELNALGLVCSIRVRGLEGFPGSPGDLPTTRPLVEALRKGDLQAFEDLLAPNFEIYRGSQMVTYWGPATLELANNKELRDALLGPRGLKAALKGKGSLGDSQMRLAAEGDCAAGCSVIKFPDNLLLQEIVFVPFAGKWRVFEIQFRK